MLRILLLTDSLGCPRKEINVDDTWTNRILKQFAGSKCVIYTYCKHGLSAIDIDMEYVQEIKPDIIILQIGIVDASRRALSRRELSVISKIPVLRDIIKKICNKYHYFITSKRNIHYCEIKTFEEIVSAMKKCSDKVGAICISPPGKMLLDRVCHIRSDISIYNKSLQNIMGLDILDPYLDILEKDYLLDDGHHLNKFGHKLVFEAVTNYLNNSFERGNVKNENR